MSTIRAVALMHQHTPGSGPPRATSTSKLARRAALVAVPFLLSVAVVLPACEVRRVRPGGFRRRRRR